MPVKAIVYPPWTQSTPILHQVSYRTSWSDEWTVTDAIWCDQVCWATAPGISRASFRHRYGTALQWQSSAWAAVPKLTIPLRGFVRVKVQGHNFSTPSTLYRDWVGVWRTVADRPGEQVFVADGLESLLSYHVIRDSQYLDTSGVLRHAYSGMTFNRDGKPNRSGNLQTIESVQTYVFEDRIGQAYYWSTRDIVGYLLATQVPRTSAGAKVFIWTLANPTALSNWDRPTVASHQRTTLELLHNLIDRRRLTSFYCQIQDLDDYPDVAQIAAFTLTDSAIVIEDDDAEEWGTIPANANQIAVSATQCPDVDRNISAQASHIADRVRVLGPRRQSVFSVSFDDESLAKGWRDEDREAYEISGRDSESYPAETEQHAREVFDRKVRAAEGMADVYARYVVPDDWDQTIPIEVGVTEPIAIDGDGTKAQHLIPLGDWEFVHELPFLTGYKYENQQIYDLQEAGERGHRGILDGAAPFTKRLPFIVFQRPDDEAQWVYGHEVARGATSDVESVDDGGVVKVAVAWDWSAGMRLFDKGDTSGLSRGFRLHIDGCERHVIAANDYDAFRAAAATRVIDDSYKGAWRYDKMVATVCVREGRQMEAVYPTSPTPVGQFVNEIMVDVSEGDYSLIYVAQRTVVGIDPETGALLEVTKSAYLQDDRPYLQTLARRLYQWYSVPRYVLSMSTGYLHCDVWLGAYVQSFTDDSGVSTIESVVTEISINFAVGINGTPSIPRVQYQTQFGELDVGALL